ncbi:oocyte zinc finger protein XlCOF7.1-like isoform X2 [Xenopus laevis]|nr:oocyte zinc finger protein XlCOF7.1-like isoform X2 [Xenopus laevis]
MGNQDPDQLHETILTLTLEIIYLLTGEGYSVTKKSGDDMPLPQSCTDCMLGGACRHHVTSPTVAPPPGSVIQKENAKKILELMSNIIQLLTGEVAIRCEDVSLYFSLEEWQYLKGNKSRYREVIKENWEQLRPLGCEWDVGADVRNANKPDKTEAEEADSWGEGNPPNPDISPTDPQTLTNCISHGIKEESWEEEEHCEWNTDPPTEQIQGTDPPTDTVGSHLNISQSDNPSDIKVQLTSWEEGEGSDWNISLATEEFQGSDPAADIMGLSGNFMSDGMKVERVSWEESDCSTDPLTEQIQGTATGIDCPSPCGSVSEPGVSESVRQEEYSCTECHECFISNKELVRHQRTQTGEKPFPCSECGKSFTHRWYLNVHRRIHTAEKPYSCSECGKCFGHGSLLKAHVKLHSVKPFSCSVCGKCFVRHVQLLDHSRTHTEEKPFSCSECGKCFTQRSYLNIHHKMHTGEKPFTCSQCGKCFVLQRDLNTHIKVHTGVKSLSCSECGKCFRFQSDLNIHFRSHTGEKPFPCSQCGKCFTRRSFLVRHQKVHSGEITFSCSYCRKSFPQSSLLAEHQQSHLGNKDLTCSVCGKCFGFHSRLNKHLKSHTGNQPFSCSECGKGFWFSSELSAHLRTHTRLSFFFSQQ